jgi:hypothetical protein
MASPLPTSSGSRRRHMARPCEIGQPVMRVGAGSELGQYLVFGPAFFERGRTRRSHAVTNTCTPQGSRRRETLRLG